jgi:hypothetical protein
MTEQKARVLETDYHTLIPAHNIMVSESALKFLFKAVFID